MASKKTIHQVLCVLSPENQLFLYLQACQVCRCYPARQQKHDM